ncbi:MAG: CRISPR system precrRNA processing endoribonuclease RAMP protein Cas6 [Spirochaetales bacterium]|nr:CRISPR system precrRNA processing endoribonuclease RAMP protein Cas6 [Spirochaetales bacterium]
MILHVEIPIEVPDTFSVNQSWGSLFHAAFQELIPLGYADQLHQSVLKPWSQHLESNNHRQVVWMVNALNHEFASVLEDALLTRLPISLQLRQKNAMVRLLEPSRLVRTSAKELADKHFLSDQVARKHKLVFTTATTFKSKGQHVLFPSTDLIMNSLLQRWDAFAEDLVVGDRDIRTYLGTHVTIREYRLSSSSFSVDSAWLKGFYGQLELKITGPDALARMAGMLLDYAKYSGLGVKTSLGMGGVSYDQTSSVFTSRNN